MKHTTLLDGLNLDAAPQSEVFAPSLLRYDLGPDMVEAFLNDLRKDDWLGALKARSQLPTRGGRPLVDQGLHRKVVLVAVDADCLVPGFPRLDPGKVTQAALVIRREATVDPAVEKTEIWAADTAGAALGWVAAPSDALTAASTFEPDAGLRRMRSTAKNPALKYASRITGDADGVSETTHPLFAIPPDIAKKIGRTIFFAPLPATSSSVVPAEAPPPPFSIDDVKTRVPNLLRPDRDVSLLPPTGSSIPVATFTSESGTTAELRSTLTRLGQEYGMFTGNPAAEALRDALAEVGVTHDAYGNLRDWFDAANAILVENRAPGSGPVSFLDAEDGPSQIVTPASWPAIESATFDAIAEAAETAMVARWSDLGPSVTRFGPPGDRYHVRCFLRIDDCPGCPPRLLWSPLSRSYTIRPWYESAGAPPQQIDLPNLSDLSNMRPDVAVKVPPEIQQFMDKLNLQGLMDGEKPKTGLSFGMICGFSIPIITICAFIILQIFLGLLNIVFYWLAFVKICIPYPKIESEE